MGYKTLALGIILLLYGIFKVTVAIITMSLTKKNKPYIERHPILNKVIKLDTTIAGKAIQISVLVFSLFTLLRGLDHLRALPSPRLKALMDHHRTTYVLYGFMGIFLTAFYAAIVLSTDARSLIDSDPKEIHTYRLVGIGSGLLFLLIMASLFLYHHYIGHSRMSITTVATTMVFISIVLTLIAAVLINSASRLAAARQEIVTMLMIPLAGA